MRERERVVHTILKLLLRHEGNLHSKLGEQAARSSGREFPICTTFEIPISRLAIVPSADIPNSSASQAPRARVRQIFSRRKF